MEYVYRGFNMNDSNEPPIDDAGINNDNILELCDFVITTCHNKYIVNEVTSDKISSQELKNISLTLSTIWGLAQDILDIDSRLRGFGDFETDEMNNE